MAHFGQDQVAVKNNLVLLSTSCRKKWQRRK